MSYNNTNVSAIIVSLHYVFRHAVCYKHSNGESNRMMGGKTWGLFGLQCWKDTLKKIKDIAKKYGKSHAHKTTGSMS